MSKSTRPEITTPEVLADEQGSEFSLRPQRLQDEDADGVGCGADRAEYDQRPADHSARRHASIILQLRPRESAVVRNAFCGALDIGSRRTFLASSR